MMTAVVVKENDPGSNGGATVGRQWHGGPVFIPRRRPSALAEKLLSQPWEDERLTAYDAQWFLGRPGA